MGAIERIKQIGTFTKAQLTSAKRQGVDLEELEYMLRAFRVMREIAADANRLSGDDFGSRALAKGKFADDSEDEVDQEFEERMKQ